MINRLKKHAQENNHRKNENGEYVINIAAFKVLTETPEQDGDQDKTDQEDSASESEEETNELTRERSRANLNQLNEDDSSDNQRPKAGRNKKKSCRFTSSESEYSSDEEKRPRRRKTTSKLEKCPITKNTRQEANDIKYITLSDKSPKRFEEMLEQIENFADLYGWSENTMNGMLVVKVAPRLLSNADFSKKNSWRKNKKLIQEKYGLSENKLYLKLDNFKRKRGESPSDSFSRLVDILNNPAVDFKSKCKGDKRRMLKTFIKKIGDKLFYTEFQQNWRTDGWPTGLNKLQKLIEETEEMLPDKTDSEDSDEVDCFMLQNAACYICGSRSHLAKHCPKRKDVNDQDIDKKIEKLGEKLKTDLKAEIITDIEKKLEAREKRTNDKLDLILSRQDEQPKSRRYNHRRSYQRPKTAPRPCQICHQTEQPYHWNDQCPQKKGQQ